MPGDATAAEQAPSSPLTCPRPPHSPTPPPAGQLEALEAGADAEGFLDRLLGTNCFTSAVGELNADCRRMDQEAKTRLALQ